MEKITVRVQPSWIVVSASGLRVWYPTSRYTKHKAALEFRLRLTGF